MQITKDLSSDITGKNIIVVEDILDSGNTLSYLLKVLEQRSPASIRLCTLLDKPERRVKPVEVHYSGFTIPDAFVAVSYPHLETRRSSAKSSPLSFMEATPPRRRSAQR